MDPEAFASLASMLKDLGLFGALLLVLVGGSRKMWIWGWQHRDIVTQITEHAERETAQAKEHAEAEVARVEAQLLNVEQERDYYRDALMRALNVSEAFVGRQ